MQATKLFLFATWL